MKSAILVLPVLGVVVALSTYQFVGGGKPVEPNTGSGNGAIVVPDSNTGNAGQNLAGGLIKPVKIVLECEEPDKLDDKAPDGTVVMKIGQMVEGQPLKYLQIPDGWIETCGLSDVKGAAGKLPGHAYYNFTVPRDDSYYIDLRAKWMDNCGNSVWVRFDQGPYYNLEDENGKVGPKIYNFVWHQLMVGGKAKGFELTAGAHVIEIATREDGPTLDQLLITTDASVPVAGALKKSAPETPATK